jgi:hypothetical protein
MPKLHFPKRSNNRRIKRSNPRSRTDVAIIRRQPRVEVKQINVSAASAAYYDGTAGSILVDVTAIGQGNSGATRVGDLLMLHSMSYRFQIYNNFGATANPIVITRILFFQYLGDSAAAGKPTVADLFNVSNANGGATYGTFSAFDIDYSRAYRVLTDTSRITFGAPAAATSTYVGLAHFGQFQVNLARAQREIQYQAGATTGNNHIFMVVTSNCATIGLNPNITYNLDVRFTDT